MAFFVLFYAYFALEVDVRLLYHCCGLIDNFPCFYRGWDFFRGFLAYPGGIVAYLSALPAQSFYYSWLGVAVVTGQAWAICWCTDRAIKAFGGCGQESASVLFWMTWSHYAGSFGVDALGRQSRKAVESHEGNPHHTCGHHIADMPASDGAVLHGTSSEGRVAGGTPASMPGQTELHLQ